MASLLQDMASGESPNPAKARALYLALHDKYEEAIKLVGHRQKMNPPRLLPAASDREEL